MATSLEDLMGAVDKTTKTVLETVGAHAQKFDKAIEGVLASQAKFAERVTALEAIEQGFKKELGEIAQRLPKTRAGALADAAIDNAIHDTDTGEKAVLNRQCRAIMAGMFAKAGDPDFGEVQANLKALQIGIGAAGGFLIPVAVQAEIIQRATLKSVMLAHGDVVQSPELTGKINRENGDFTWSSTPELTQPTETTFTTLLNQLTFMLTTQAAFATLSNKFMKYAPTDMVGWLTDKAGRSYQAKADDWFINGSGSGEPRGLRIGENVNSYAQAGTTVGSFDWTDLVEIEAALPIAYRSDAVFIINDTSRKLIAKLADTTGNPIFMGVAQMQKLGLTVNYKNQQGVINLPGGTAYPFFLASTTALPSTLGSSSNQTEIWFGVPRFYRIWMNGNMEVSQDSAGANFRAGQTQIKFETDIDGALLLGESWAKGTGIF